MVRLVRDRVVGYVRETESERTMAAPKTRLSLPHWGRRSDAAEADTRTAVDGNAKPEAPSRATIEPLRPRAPRPSSRRRAAPVPELPAAPTQATHLRILLIEDVEDVAAHIRELLRASSSTRLVGIVRDGRTAVDEVRELRPDIVIVDTLLRGRTKGVTLGRRLREAGINVGVIAITVPDRPIRHPERHGIDAVVDLPLTTFDLGRAIGGAMTSLRERDPARSQRIVAVFGPKGGVGRTTIAFNLATALAVTGLRTALVDGSLQYGDIRRLLRIGPGEPSICDLPTDSVRATDLAETLIHDASGVDVLLAPPRPEMAELVSARDLEAIIDLLRRTYQAVVIDTPTNLGESTLVMLDAADLVLNIVTPETGAIDAAKTALDAFTAMGYPDPKVQVVLNRADARGGMTPAQVTRALGRVPAAQLPSDWQLVSAANAEGVPFVTDRPDAPISIALEALAASVAAVVGSTPTAIPVRHRRRRVG
jgi:pilus assembly protein CpaE